MNYFKVRNFEQFQHYKHRNPPWIKLYFGLLHDRRFFRLDDASKWLAVGIFLLASQHDNKIAFDPDWIERELSLSEPPNWQALLDAEFIIPIDCDASTLLATCTQHASQSRVEKSRVETETEILSFSQKSPKLGIKECSEVFKFWNAQSGLLHHRAMNGSEKSILKALKSYSPDEIKLAISRYSILRVNQNGRYRDVYAWTLSEFLSRQNGYNLERLTAENWEDPFVEKQVNAPLFESVEEHNRRIAEEYRRKHEQPGTIHDEPVSSLLKAPRL